MNPDAPSASPFDPLEEALFNSAAELTDPGARRAFLERVCGNDAALKNRLETLLAADDKATRFFRDDPFGLEAKAPPIPAPPSSKVESGQEWIGRYKLLEKIGEGGMGVVYMAQQQEPVRRRVALKVIKLGMDTASVVARFEAERQALALMDHPNIARIFDGGATETGRPYFVMELVHGVAITDYCDKNKLPVTERIQLFLKVCEAVQSAHQKGIIHRDIKPSNVMVTLQEGEAVPKVIDFGVAKATSHELTTKTLFTHYGTMIGTPAYMSPEQAEGNGLDVDTRSDLYSLGVLLYELLAGTTPFPEERLRKAAYSEMQRILTQEEAPRLRTRVSSMDGATRSMIAANRSVDSVSLAKSLQGDLESIVLKCLEKDRKRRYDSVSALAADILRHMNNEPVLARPASPAYRLQKFIRRNRVGVSIGLVVALAILVSVIVAATSYRQTAAAALQAARFQYASDVNLARLAAEDGNFFRALQLLDRHRPAAASSKLPDLRGWEWRYLLHQCRTEELASLGAHPDPVTTVAFAPDGKTAVSGGNDRMLRIWDVHARRETGALKHDGNVIGAQFSPDARWLAVAAEHRLTIREWPSQTVRYERTNGWFRMNTLAFSPNGRQLAFARYTDGFSLFDLETGEETPVFPAEHGWLAPIGVAFSPDAQTLAFDSGDGEIIFWNIRDRSIKRRWAAHSWYITRIFFSTDGLQLFSGSSDRTVKVWDIATEQELRQIDYPMGFGASRYASPRLSADGKFLATATHGGGMAITIQEMPDGREVRTLRGNKDMVSDTAFSPDGRLLLSGSYDGSVRLWDLTFRQDESDVRPFSQDYQQPKGPANAYALSPDGRHLACFYTNGTFTVRELPSLIETPRRAMPLPGVSAIGVANGGQMVAFAGRTGNVVLWHAETGATNLLALPLVSEPGRATFSADGKKLAVGNSTTIAVCDLETKRIRTFKFDDPSVLFWMNFSQLGDKLMAGYFNGNIRVWDLSRPNPEPTKLQHDWQVNSMLLLPGEKTLVSASRQVVFWDLETGARKVALQPRAGLFRAVALSLDGSRLAAGGADGMITIWDLASMQEVATLSGHTRPLMDMRFLPDGNTLVSVSVNDVRIWRAAPLAESKSASTK